MGYITQKFIFLELLVFEMSASIYAPTYVYHFNFGELVSEMLKTDISSKSAEFCD